MPNPFKPDLGPGAENPAARFGEELFQAAAFSEPKIPAATKTWMLVVRPPRVGNQIGLQRPVGEGSVAGVWVWTYLRINFQSRRVATPCGVRRNGRNNFVRTHGNKTTPRQNLAARANSFHRATACSKSGMVAQSGLPIRSLITSLRASVGLSSGLYGGNDAGCTRGGTACRSGLG